MAYVNMTVDGSTKKTTVIKFNGADGNTKQATLEAVLEASDTQGGGITPSGKKTITNMQEQDVTQYATAQVVDNNLTAGNIKKDVSILGITGTYDGEGGGASGDGIKKGSFTLDSAGVPPVINHNFGSMNYMYVIKYAGDSCVASAGTLILCAFGFAKGALNNVNVDASAYNTTAPNPSKVPVFSENENIGISIGAPHASQAIPHLQATFADRAKCTANYMQFYSGNWNPGTYNWAIVPIPANLV